MGRSRNHSFPYKGNILRSKFELGIAKDLDERGIKYTYETYQYEYFEKITNGICEDCDGTHVAKRRWYTPDFFLPNGLVLEAKGFFTASNRATLKAVRDSHPTIDVRLVFMVNNKINRNSELRYTDWCDKHGFKWAMKVVPEEWINDG